MFKCNCNKMLTSILPRLSMLVLPSIFRSNEFFWTLSSSRMVCVSLNATSSDSAIFDTSFNFPVIALAAIILLSIFCTVDRADESNSSSVFLQWKIYQNKNKFTFCFYHQIIGIATNCSYPIVDSTLNGSFKRDRSSFPSRTIRPISSINCSRFSICRRNRSNFSSLFSDSDSASIVSFNSLSCWHCSSIVRWKTADTLNRVICSWLIFSKCFHVSRRFFIFSRLSISSSLHDIRKANDASSNWFPYSKIL